MVQRTKVTDLDVRRARLILALAARLGEMPPASAGEVARMHLTTEVERRADLAS